MPRTLRRNSRRDDDDTPEIRRVKWSMLRPDMLEEWNPGEHVAIIGRTGSGKTTVALDLLEARADERGASVVVLASKRRDETVKELGWPIIERWPPDFGHRIDRKVILWPSYGKASEAPDRKQKVFTDALDAILEEGGWTVYLDEAIYFTETLNLRRLLDEYWNTARSSGITVIASSQGTTWIPKAMTTQQSWVFGFHYPSMRLRDELAEVMGDRDTYEAALSDLRPHEFLLVRTLSQHAYVSKVGT